MRPSESRDPECRRSSGRAGVLVVLIVVIGCVVALAGCASSRQSRTWIKSTVDAFLTGTDPASCRVLITVHFAEQITALRGSDAVGTCERQARRATEGDADAVRVGKVTIRGRVAHAVVAIQGGDYNGQLVDLLLVEQHGLWKLYSFDRLIKLDRRKLARAFASEYRKRHEPTATGVGRCFLEILHEAPKAKIEGYLFSGPRDLIRGAYEGCAALSASRSSEE
jgi:hypothetical protein